MYIQCIGVYLQQAKPEEVESIIDAALEQFEIDLKRTQAVYLKTLAFIFSSIDSKHTGRARVFQQLVKICRENGKEYLFLPYVENLHKLINFEEATADIAIGTFVPVLEVLREKEKLETLSKTINTLFNLLSTKPDEEVMKHKDQLYRSLTYLVLDEERIFLVENFLYNPLVQKIFGSDEKLKQSWSTFTSGNLKGADEFFKQNEKYFKELNLTVEDLKNKMRFYRISQIADEAKQIGIQDLAKQLECSEDDVEFLMIKAVQYGYVNALIDQITQTVYFKEVYARNLKNSSKKDIDQQFDRIVKTFSKFSETRKKETA